MRMVSSSTSGSSSVGIMLLCIFLPLILGGIITAIVLLVSHSKNKTLVNCFQMMGNPVNRSYQEIINICGCPTSTIPTNEGIICTWNNSSYSVSLLFYNDICYEVKQSTFYIPGVTYR